MDLLSVSEKNNVESILRDYEIISQAVAKLYIAFPNPNEWSFSNHVGVVSLVKKYDNFSFNIVDPEKREIIWKYDIDEDMSYQKVEDYLHVFPYKTIKCTAGFSFTSETEAQIFYNCVVNRNIGKVSPVSSRIGSPRLPTVSPVATTIKIDTKKDDKKKHKKEKKEKKKKGLFGFGSKSKSKSKKGKKGGIDKSQIGKPTNFRHEQYIGYDPEKGFVTQNASPEWQEIFKMAGITPEVLADDKSRKIVNKFIKQHKDTVITSSAITMKKEKRQPPPPPPPKKRAPPPPPPQKRTTQARKAPPPPPPPHRKTKKAPPPPPPSRKPVKQTKLAPPPPSRPAASVPPPPPLRPAPAPAASVSIPPPPPTRPAPATSSIPAPPPPPARPAPATSSIPAPPPPPARPAPATSSIPVPPPPPPASATSSIPAPPPPPPPAPATSSIPAPPPPPARPAPATSSVPAPPPPPPTGNARNDLFASIRNAGGIASLKHVDESQKRDASGLITAGSSAGPRPLPPPPSSSGPQVGMSNDLLASIRNAGIGSLKHVDKSKIRDASSAKPAAAASSENTNDLAAALAHALSLRNDAFGSDDDSDSESEESDSDSSEWSD